MKFNYHEVWGLDIFEGIPQTRSAVRSRLGEPTNVLPKTAFSQNSTDVFGNAALRVWYTGEEEMLGIELYHPEVEFVFFGKQILGACVFELESSLTRAGLKISYNADGTGVSSEDGDLRFYAPNISEEKEQAKVLAVYISARR
jgi:hypothetical protein